MHHFNPTQFLPGWLARLPTMTSFSRTLAWMKRATRVDVPFIRSVACARLAPVADPDRAHELLLVHGLISQHALGNVGHVVARRQKIWENHLQCAPIQRMDARFSVHGAHVRGCRFFRSVETRPPRPVERLVASGHRWRNTHRGFNGTCVAVARGARGAREFALRRKVIVRVPLLFFHICPSVSVTVLICGTVLQLFKMHLFFVRPN
jgi:hypothetical protein